MMYKKIQLTVFSGLIAISGSSMAQLTGLPLDLYIGGAVGNSVTTDDNDDAIDIDSLGSIGGKVFGGLMVNKYIGVEGQFVHFGEAEVTINGVSDDDELSGWGFAATGNLPIINQLSLNGRIGFLSWETDDDDGTDLHVGGGLRFDVIEHFAVRADWDYYPLDGGDLETNMVSIGGQFTF